MSTAQQVYSSEVLILPPSEQLRLATLILEGLTRTAAPALDFSDQWSQEDMQDLASFSLEYAARTMGEE